MGGKRRPDEGWRLDPRSVPHVLGTTEFAGERRCAWPGRLLDCVEVLRAEIGELGGAIRQLRRSGMDSAAAELLITRKRAELETLLNAKAGASRKIR